MKTLSGKVNECLERSTCICALAATQRHYNIKFSWRLHALVIAYNQSLNCKFIIKIKKHEFNNIFQKKVSLAKND